MKPILCQGFGDELITAKVGNEYFDLEPSKDFKFRDYTFEEAICLMFYDITKEEHAYLILNTEIN